MAATRSKIRVGIDLDGVIADFAGGWIRLYNAQFGTEILPEQITTWDAAEQLTHFDTMTSFWHWARTAGDNGRSLFAILKPYPGAVAGLRALLDAAHVVIITTKPAWAIPDTLDWLARLRLPLREVHITFDSRPCRARSTWRTRRCNSPHCAGAARTPSSADSYAHGTARSTAAWTSPIWTTSWWSSPNSRHAADRLPGQAAP